MYRESAAVSSRPRSTPSWAVRVVDHDERVAKHRVLALILDEHNLTEMARHGVFAAEVVQVIGNRHITVPNPRGELGSILLIGKTDGGRVLMIPLAPTDDPTTWRPATAFDASRHQRAVFRRRAR